MELCISMRRATRDCVVNELMQKWSKLALKSSCKIEKNIGNDDSSSDSSSDSTPPLERLRIRKVNSIPTITNKER